VLLVFEGLCDLVSDLDEIDVCEISIVLIGEDVVLCVGCYGFYVEVIGEDGELCCVMVFDDVVLDELIVEKVCELFIMSGDEGCVLGEDLLIGCIVVVKVGCYGLYVIELVEDDEDDDGMLLFEVLEFELDVELLVVKKVVKKIVEEVVVEFCGCMVSLFEDVLFEIVIF